LNMGSDQQRLERGVFVISIDTELAWSVVHRGKVPPEQLLPSRSAAERKIVEDLLELFARYETKATWATVGHLFIDSCREVEGRKHPEIVRPAYDWFEGDWFDLDPATDEVALAFEWKGSPDYRRIRALADGIAAALAARIAAGGSLYVMLDGDIAQTLGAILRQELGISNEMMIIDGVILRDFDYIDLGKIRLPSFTVPVTIKSLIFSDDAPGKHRRERIHHREEGGHGHTHHHGHDHHHSHRRDGHHH